MADTLAELKAANAVVKEMGQRIVEAQKDTAKFADNIKAVSQARAKLNEPMRLRAEVAGLREELLRLPLEKVKQRFQEMTVPARVREDWKKFREEQKAFATETSVRGRAAGALGMQHGGGLKEAAKGAAGGALGKLGVESLNPWMLAAKAAMAVASKAADATRNSLDLLITSGGKLTAANVLGTASQVASAFAKNEFVALKWGAALEEVNKATMHFAERAGLSVGASQQFTEQLARGARMMGVDFGEATEFASEQMTQLGKSSEETLKTLDTVAKVSKISAGATGQLGEKAGKTGGVFAKDLLKSVREVSRETGLFKNNNELLAVTLGNVYMGAVKLGAGYGTAMGATRAFGKMLSGMSEWGQHVAGAPVRRAFTRNIKQWETELAALEAKARKGGGTLKGAEARRHGELQQAIGAAKLAGGAGIEGPAFALKAALEGMGGEKMVTLALKNAIGTIFRGEGLGMEGFHGAARAQGLSARETTALYGLMKDLVSGNKDITKLTDEQKKQLEKVVSITGKAETAEQALVGKLTASTDVMGTLLASINALVGGVAAMVMKLGALVSTLIQKWFPKSTKLATDVESGRQAGAGKGFVDVETLTLGKKTERALSSGKKKESDLTAEEKAALDYAKAHREGVASGAGVGKLPFATAPEEETKVIPPAPDKKGGRGRGRGRGRAVTPPVPPPPPEDPYTAAARKAGVELESGPVLKMAPGKKPGAFMTPREGTPEVPKIIPTAPEPEAPKTAALGGGGGGKGSAAGPPAPGTLAGIGSMKRGEDGSLNMTIKVAGYDEAAASFLSDRATVVGNRIRTT